MAALGEVAVGINDVFEIDALGNHLLGIQVVQVHAMAQFIHLGRCLGAKAALGCEFKAVARHVGVTIDLKRPVSATAQTHRCALEIAHRGIEIDGEHIGQVGTRSDRQRVASLMSVVLARDDREVTLLAVFEPAFAIGHLRQLT